MKGALKYGDADRNGIVNFDDTIVVLANMGSDCSLLEFAGGGGNFLEETAAALGAALEAMGFESLEGFMKAFEAADKDERDSLIQTLGDLLVGSK